MIQVSTGSLIALVCILLVCFVLPLPLYYLLYRAECKGKNFLIGAAAYIGCGVLADTVLGATVDMIANTSANAASYLLYAAILSPVLFIALNYLIIKRFGTKTMTTTGDSLMYSLGYASAYNILATGFVSAMYFFTLMEIKGRNGVFTVVSDADYVSASQVVTSGDLVNESVYADMVRLCSQPVSYYIGFIINCLWALAAYAAVFMVLRLAVQKKEKKHILAYALMIRLFITLPDIMKHFDIIRNVWLAQLFSFVILGIVWVAAIFCRKTFVDSEDAVTDSNGNKKGEA